ncbi:PAS domain S-box protein [uncultured Methanomethylovorans sp.]|uniref:PAS domain S-box protein n=1 Tax=uncultured Methanomethylovorans sp. TaxID=183759 RepID=UPI002AA8FC34|nr:PAS domain S-box protein [uncultured Methanomethylovorans sp.]
MSFIWKVDERWPVEWVSANIAQLGYTPEEFMSGKLDYADIVHPEDYGKINSEVKKLLKKGNTSYFTLVYRILTKSGEVRYVTERSLLKRDDDGIISRYQGIIIDNTEKEKAESTLEDVERKYHLLFEKAPLGILCFDENGTIINCNHICLKIIAEPLSRVLGLNILQYVGEGALKAAIDLVFLGESGHFEGEYISPVGKKFTIKAEFSPIMSEDGCLIGGLGLIQDISELQGTEEKIHLNEARLEALLELHQRADSSVSEIVEFAIEKAVRLTHSQIGYLGLLQENEKSLEIYAWPMQKINGEKKSWIFPVNSTGMWGEAIREREPIVNNKFSGSGLIKGIISDQDIKINRYINVPVMDGDQVVAVAAVANKSNEYDSSDVRQLTLLFDGMWKLVQCKLVDWKLIETRKILKVLESVINDSPAVVFIWSPEDDWPVEFVSKNIERFGYSVEDFLSGKMVYGDIIHPADLEKVRTEVARCYKEGYSDFSQEYRVLTKLGEVRWVDERTLIHHDLHGEIDFLQGIIVDVTERKQATNFVQVESDFDNVLSSGDNLQDMFEKILDFALQIKAVDCGAIYLIDNSEGDFEMMAYRGLSDKFADNFRHFAPNTIQARLFTTGYPVYKYFSEISDMIKGDLDYEGLQAMGFIPVNYNEKLIASMILGSHKELEIPANSRNVIDTIANQLGLIISRFREGTPVRKDQNGLQDLFDTMDDLIFIMDMGGLIIHANHALQKYLKYSRKDLSKMDFLELFPPGKEEEVLESIDIEGLISGNSSRCYVPLMSKDRNFLSSDTKFFIGKWDGREALIGVARLSASTVDI